MMPTKFLSILLLTVVEVSSCQRFDFSSSLTRSPGLQVDGAGNLYTAAGNQLFRLNSSNLVLKEARQLSSEAVKISLSSDGRWLVVCLTDLSCEVYNATNFSTGHIFRKEGAITSTENIALFAAEDSFYVGETIEHRIFAATIEYSISLKQYGFAGKGTATAGLYLTDRSGFERNFYSGFVRGNNTYFFVVDSNPSGIRNVRVMRVCHNSNFKALYELTLGCGPRTVASDTRISGMSVVEDFGGLSGPVVILSRNRPLSSHNYVCLYRLEEIDSIMQAKYNACTTHTTSTIGEEWIKMVWKRQSTSCTKFLPTGSICKFTVSTQLALDDYLHQSLSGDFRVHIGELTPGQSANNFITASVAVVVDSFSLVFIAYTDPNGDFFIVGFDVSTSGVRYANDGFDIRQISDGPVSQLEWHQGANFIYAMTTSSIIQVPTADCASWSNYSSCLGNGNPLCGWCYSIVVKKCSKQNECQNPDTRWIRANRSASQYLHISVSPSQFDLETSQALTLTLSRSLPPPLTGETYLCHFASDGVTFTVNAEGDGTMYTCNVTGMIPSEYSGLSTVIDISFASSLLEIPFSTSLSALTIFHCGFASSCSQCLQTDNVCGWCVYNKVCSGTPVPCLATNDHEGFIQLTTNQDYTDVCPLLDRPPGRENYLQPVNRNNELETRQPVNRNIELVTRNLPAEISGYTYNCSVDGINLPAVYNNESSLTCLVSFDQSALLSGIGQRKVTVAIQWIGQQNSHRRHINHTIDSAMPINVLLYSCPDLADGCSSCLSVSLERGFECGWCDGSNGMADSCSFTGDCQATLQTDGSQCPDPTVTGINPTSGPPEGGTTITITGRELGVTFDDFTADSIIIGDDQNGVPCTPTDSESFIPDRRIRCITTGGGTLGSNAIQISISSRNGMSSVQFQFVSPEIVGVVPSRGPQAGGTRLTVNGTDLNIGNVEDTRITLAGGTECIVDPDTIQATSISCTTPAFNLNGSSPVTGEVLVMIDNATITNGSVQFMYTPNPEFYSVTPSSTILGGGIELIFLGTNLDVVVNPMLVVSDPQYLDATNSTLCTILNSTAISCITPPLNRIQPGDTNGVNYTIVIDNAPGPDLTKVSLQISVLPNPGDFVLVDFIYTVQDIARSSPIRITGENISLSSDFYSVAVGGGSCAISLISDTQINCVPPPDPPRGNVEATVTVSVGRYLMYTLDKKLTYDIGVANQMQSGSNLSTILPATLVPLLLVIIALATLIVTVILYYRRGRKVNVDTGDGRASSDDIAMSSLLQSSNLQVIDEELLKKVPEKFIIPSSQLQLTHSQTIGQGEFGVIYKARLMNWQGRYLPQTVAVKTLKGLFTTSDVESMLAEIIKMKELHHCNIMPLIGVCLDAGPGMSIVMPFMANGSLLDYLKKERDDLYLSDKSELEDILSVQKLLLRMCHQVSKGMEFLSQNKVVHRDLAARNCMLDSMGNVKIGDFGLAEDVYLKGYFKQGKDDAVKLPFKWMAPESLRDGFFSEKSDVWSFGITCWEVFSAGRIPYSGADAINMLKILEKGTRLEKPDNAACAPEIYSAVVQCWALHPEDRPNFQQLEVKVGKLLNLVADYMELTMQLLPSEEKEEVRYELETVKNPVAKEQEAVQTEVTVHVHAASGDHDQADIDNIVTDDSACISTRKTSRECSSS